MFPPPVVTIILVCTSLHIGTGRGFTSFLEAEVGSTGHAPGRLQRKRGSGFDSYRCLPGKSLMPGSSGRTRCPAHIRSLRTLGYPVQKPLQQPRVLKIILGGSSDRNNAMILLFFFCTYHHKRSLTMTSLHFSLRRFVSLLGRAASAIIL